MRISDVQRVLLGTFIRPPEETGTGRPRVESALGYVIRHDRGVILLDTGLGRTDPETEAWYRPQRIPMDEALGGLGLGVDDIGLVVNCHLHFDHCGGNALFAGTPVVCQQRELATARAGDYTFLDLVDHPGARFEELDGEAELVPGVLVVPTPGHVDGHQSLAVRCDDGTVVLAGQSHDRASDFTADALAVRAHRSRVEKPLPQAPAWMDRLLDLDPARVFFAHDAAVWQPE